jgi:hypothetical protein
MRRVSGILLAILILWFSNAASGQQTATIPSQAETPATPNRLQDCGSRDNQLTPSNPYSASPHGSNAQDNVIRPEAGVCTVLERNSGDPRSFQNGCSFEQVLNFQMANDGEPEIEIPILRLPGTTAFFYESGMTIDADGAPNAYHPENTGLDDLANAGAPGNWQGLAKDGDGQPFVQGPNDPFPGYFVSATALADHTKPVNDPTRYVDASKIPFIVLPGGMTRQIGARPGDFAVVYNHRNGKSSYAIFADVGPSTRIGEGSMALAENLGIRSDARNGGTRRGVLFLVFPGSGNGRPRTIEEINAESEKLLHGWGGIDQVTSCTAGAPGNRVAGN